MDPVSLGLGLGGIGASLIGGLFGASVQDKATQAQIDMFNKMKAELDVIPLPELREVKLQEYRQAGLLTPQIEQALTLGPSAMEQVSVDPRLREAQMRALNQLGEISDKGYTAQEQAAMQKIMDQVNAQEQGQRGALMQSLQARGLGGGGADLAASLSAIQGGANRASQEGLGIEAQAQQRALQALMQEGNLGQSMERTQFGEASDIAAAKDAISRFNLQNNQAVQQRNIAAQNAAQAGNLELAQQLANQNVVLQNEMLNQPNSLAMQKYNNQLRKADALSGIQGKIASTIGQQGQQQASQYGGIGAGVGQGLGQLAQYYNQPSYSAPIVQTPDFSQLQLQQPDFLSASKKKNPYSIG